MNSPKEEAILGLIALWRVNPEKTLKQLLSWGSAEVGCAFIDNVTLNDLTNPSKKEWQANLPQINLKRAKSLMRTGALSYRSATHPDNFKGHVPSPGFISDWDFYTEQAVSGLKTALLARDAVHRETKNLETKNFLENWPGGDCE